MLPLAIELGGNDAQAFVAGPFALADIVRGGFFQAMEFNPYFVFADGAAFGETPLVKPGAILGGSEVFLLLYGQPVALGPFLIFARSAIPSEALQT